MFQNERIIDIIAVCLLLIAAQVIVIVEYLDIPRSTQRASQKQVVCTQEAKQCPDGSAVSRTGPNCEFEECAKPSIAQVERQDISDIVFNQKAEELCGPQPPAVCQSGKQLGCNSETRQWSCYSIAMDVTEWKAHRFIE